jgi:maltooligosyltrehalose trehalohydrolase
MGNVAPPSARSAAEGRLGATARDGGSTRFLVWAPNHERIDLHLLSPHDEVVRLEARERGYHELTTQDVGAGAVYKFRLPDGRELPDPASRYQPEGVHGPSQVIGESFAWTDAGWRGIELAEYVIYELHVGTFSEIGTFEGVIERLDSLRDLGVTAIEIMPVAQFPGERNWGYDGVGLYAPQNSYGGPDGLRRLVDAAHARGLAVVLDVVYNHLGPEGNYLGEFGPYFTDRYKTVWGAALNYDGPESDEVRRFFIENALMWVREYHVDALRLDAVHAIIDHSAKTFLEELADAIHEEARRSGRRIYLMPETDLNNPRLVQERERGGFGLDAQWNDDFHHALHALLTDERGGYYCDYGGVGQLARAFRRGYAYAGEYSEFRRRCHGAEPTGLSGEKFIVFAQNHDQIGNRMLGERLSTLTTLEGLKLAAGAVVLSPFIPLIFMGEEYGETAPFLYFVDHGEPELLEAVRRGRAAEFASFGWREEPPDPASFETFARSRPNFGFAREKDQVWLREFYRTLLRLRRTHAALSNLSLEEIDVSADEEAKTLVVRRWADDGEALVAYNFSEKWTPVRASAGETLWHIALDSASDKWRGPGSQSPDRLRAGDQVTLAPRSFVLYLDRVTE